MSRPLYRGCLLLGGSRFTVIRISVCCNIQSQFWEEMCLQFGSKERGGRGRERERKRKGKGKGRGKERRKEREPGTGGREQGRKGGIF